MNSGVYGRWVRACAPAMFSGPRLGGRGDDLFSRLLFLCWVRLRRMTGTVLVREKVDLFFVEEGFFS
ncbi:hypothetical protein STSP2_00616 [Anaerohalosphaera lusitana]|uniref:Uncharacterized protein n=1 Tax=Anaerohalosphaera lusitana TaxID=1936003 RepID=A0A1U9NHS3_9BACT|nr:hypothetical protein STSP2_00616 [Anaerohalosphaera lusitana]